MRKLKIIIAGGRDFDDYAMLRRETLRIVREIAMKNTGTTTIKKEIVEIVSGAARGADRLGEQFSKEFNLRLKQFHANWNLYGNMAGYMRNSEMARYAISDEANGVLIAFWDGKSRGTKHMIETAKKSGMSVYVVSYNK